MRNREGPTVKATRQDETVVVPATERNAPHGCDQQENRAFLRKDWVGNTTVQDWVVRGAVAGRQILKIVQARARRAQWLLRFHKKKAALRKFGAALRALGVTLNFEYHRLDGLTQLFSDLLLFALGQSRRDIVVQ